MGRYRDADVAELVAAAVELVGALDAFETAEVADELTRVHAALDRLDPDGADR